MPSFSAFITRSIPSKTTSSEVIWASTEKAFLFLNGSRSIHLRLMHLQSQLQQSVVQVHLCLAEDGQQTQLSAANRWRIAAAHVRENKPVHTLLRARGRLVPSLWRMPWEFSPLINASRMSSSRYCSALTAWKVHSFESSFKA